jgi:hypothetical protein
MDDRGLSFSEVKQAGQDAWQHSGGYRYWFDGLDGGVWFEGPADCPGIFAWPLREPESRAPAYGWRHVPDCACELCRSGRASEGVCGESGHASPMTVDLQAVAYGGARHAPGGERTGTEPDER